MENIITILNKILDEQEAKLEAWFDSQYLGHEPVIYSSVDLRYSGVKLVPVDTNLFPAGFNNLGSRGKKNAVAEFGKYVKKHMPAAKNIMIIPENFTRNLHYLDNLAVIGDIVEEAGYNYIFGSVDAKEVLSLESETGREVTLYPVSNSEGVISAANGFIPDFVVVNNDMSEGVPNILKGVKQPIVPSVDKGWHSRTKTKHFEKYDMVAKSFAEEFGFDAFYITTMNKSCGEINFKEKKGIECIALAIEKAIYQLKNLYAKHNIEDAPYLFVKANRGTFGMGIMTVNSAEDLYNMNKKIRNKMDVIKGGVLNQEVIIQEGVKTIEKIDGATAEPMIYLVGGKAVDCIFRVNTEHDEFGNLNSSGMHFEKNVCEEELENSKQNNNEICRKYKAFGLIARLASLAASLE